LRSFKIMAVILGIYFLLWVPAYFWSDYLATPFGMVAAIPILAIYLFHGIGIPGLLEHNGHCGWGWCGPTPLGWGFLIVFWLLVVWLLAWLIARLSRRTPR
jgi:hypothetical protein